MRSWIRCMDGESITIGNKSNNAYQYPSDVCIVNTNVIVEGSYSDLFPCVYVYANESESNGVTLNMDGNTLSGGTDPQIVFGNEKENVTVKESVARIGGEYAVLPGADGVTIQGCTFDGQSVMAIYTPDNTGAHNLVVDSCAFNDTRIAILWDNETITNCTATGNTDYYQLTIVGGDTVVTGNTFSAPLELFAQAKEIKKE